MNHLDPGIASIQRISLDSSIGNTKQIQNHRYFSRIFTVRFHVWEVATDDVYMFAVFAAPEVCHRMVTHHGPARNFHNPKKEGWKCHLGSNPWWDTEYR